MLSGQALLAQKLDRHMCTDILQHLAVDCANRLHAYDAQRRCHCHSLGRAPQGEGQGCKGSCNHSQQGTSDARQLSRHCTSGCGGGCGVCCGRGRPQAQGCCHPNREWADPPGEMAQCLLCQLWHLLWVWLTVPLASVNQCLNQPLSGIAYAIVLCVDAAVLTPCAVDHAHLCHLSTAQH